MIFYIVVKIQKLSKLILQIIFHDVVFTHAKSQDHAR